MRRRLGLSRRGLAGGLALLAALVVGAALAPDLSPEASGAPPAVLNRIAQKNERAASEAAARMRAESEATARAVDSRRAAAERGPDAARP